MNEQSIRVMSFNLRVTDQKGLDGINHFDYRKPRILAMLQAEQPDILCLQEAVPISFAWLRSTLSDCYELVWCGRDRHCGGEGIPVAYRRDRFRLLSFSTFWLSDTPQVPGSVYQGLDQSTCPRLAHVVDLFDTVTDRRLRVVNTHLDHKGEQARAKGLEQLLPYLADRELPTVLTGDLNAEPRSAEIVTFTERIRPLGWTDATAALGGTFHGYGTCTPKWKIDYIFSNRPSLGSHVVEDVPVNGVYYSDHNAVVADLQLDH